MQALDQSDDITPTQYLRDELDRPIKHEYLGGVVYAMSGAKIRHNKISGALFFQLYSQLRDRKCQCYNSDTKVRIQFANHVRFYYPDAMVVCDSNSESESYQDRPQVVVEVLSASTRRIDQGEKKEAYLNIPSLRLYLLVEQDLPKVTAYRRGELGFQAEVYRGLEAVVPLPEVGCQILLSDIYERIEFGAEPDEDSGEDSSTRTP